MPPGDRQYWIRTEHGRVWGPYPIGALERLRGQLTEKAQASLDGQQFRSGMDFPELRALLTSRSAAPAAPSTPPPPKANPTPAAGMSKVNLAPAAGMPKVNPTPAAGMYIGPALRAMIEGTGKIKRPEEPAATPPPEKPVPPAPKPAAPPVMRSAAVMHSEKLELSEQGSLADIS